MHDEIRPFAATGNRGGVWDETAVDNSGRVGGRDSLCSNFGRGAAAGGCYEGVQRLSAQSVELMEQRESQVTPDGSYQALPGSYLRPGGAVLPHRQRLWRVSLRLP